jgi:hypothetical protein
MKKSQMKKRWMWLAAVAGLTLILLATQALSGTGRSGKDKKM